MSALSSLAGSTPAHRWFAQNLPEIQSRARACLARLHPAQREEALAEVMGAVFTTSVHAHRRGTLAKITPFHAVNFAAKHYRAGRRLAGTSSTDVMSEATQIQGRCQVVSLSSIAEHNAETGRPLPYSEVLADRRQDNNPLEKVRQNMDYPLILRQERMSRQARKVFRLLAEVRGRGANTVIAHELKVSPGRVSQIKDQLAEALARHDYRPASARRSRPRGAAVPPRSTSPLSSVSGRPRYPKGVSQSEPAINSTKFT